MAIFLFLVYGCRAVLYVLTTNCTVLHDITLMK